jgi:hypothetical protein
MASSLSCPDTYSLLFSHHLVAGEISRGMLMGRHGAGMITPQSKGLQPDGRNPGLACEGGVQAAGARTGAILALRLSTKQWKHA